MHDYRLVAARRLVWDKEAWRQPAMLALAIKARNQILDDETESKDAQVEAESLIKKLYAAGRAPALG